MSAHTQARFLLYCFLYIRHAYSPLRPSDAGAGKLAIAPKAFTTEHFGRMSCPDAAAGEQRGCMRVSGHGSELVERSREQHGFSV